MENSKFYYNYTFSSIITERYWKSLTSDVFLLYHNIRILFIVIKTYLLQIYEKNLNIYWFKYVKGSIIFLLR